MGWVALAEVRVLSQRLYQPTAVSSRFSPLSRDLLHLGLRNSLFHRMAVMNGRGRQ